jgi:hypothetical protein
VGVQPIGDVVDDTGIHNVRERRAGCDMFARSPNSVLFSPA